MMPCASQRARCLDPVRIFVFVGHTRHGREVLKSGGLIRELKKDRKALIKRLHGFKQFFKCYLRSAA